MKALGFAAGERFGDAEDPLNFGVVSELDPGMELDDLVRRVEFTLGNR